VPYHPDKKLESPTRKEKGMKKDVLVKALKKQTKDNLISLLLDAYEVLNAAKRYEIFNSIYTLEKEPKFNALKIFKAVKKFYDDSLAKKVLCAFCN
jgi:hypothetical protein